MIRYRNYFINYIKFYRKKSIFFLKLTPKKYDKVAQPPYENQFSAIRSSIKCTTSSLLRPAIYQVLKPIWPCPGSTSPIKTQTLFRFCTCVLPPPILRNGMFFYSTAFLFNCSLFKTLLHFLHRDFFCSSYQNWSSFISLTFGGIVTVTGYSFIVSKLYWTGQHKITRDNTFTGKRSGENKGRASRLPHKFLSVKLYWFSD